MYRYVHVMWNNMKYITSFFIIEIYIYTHDKIKIKLHYIYKHSSGIYKISNHRLLLHHMSKTSSSKIDSLTLVNQSFNEILLNELKKLIAYSHESGSPSLSTSTR